MLVFVYEFVFEGFSELFHDAAATIDDFSVLDEFLKQLLIVDLGFGTPREQDCQQTHLEGLRLSIVFGRVVQFEDVCIFFFICHQFDVFLCYVIAVLLLEKSSDYIAVVATLEVDKLLYGHCLAHC